MRVIFPDCDVFGDQRDTVPDLLVFQATLGPIANRPQQYAQHGQNLVG
jgi:hypothetical protein